MTIQPTGEDSVQVESTTLTRIANTRLGDEAAERLRRYIIDGGFKEGLRLPSERALAAQLGISRSTVSQALRILSVVGLVDIRQGSGVYVKHDPGSMIGASMDLMIDLDPASVAELADYRYVLERMAVGQPGAIERVDREALIDALDGMNRSDGRVSEWVEADARFHLAVIAGADNRYLLHAFEHAHRKILSVTHSAWIHRGAGPKWLAKSSLVEQLQHHRDISDAIAAMDENSLELALGRHQDEVLAHLESVTRG